MDVSFDSARVDAVAVDTASLDRAGFAEGARGFRGRGAGRAALVSWSHASATRALVLFGCLVVLNGLDLVTTHLVLERGGREVNPLLAPVIDGMVWAAGAKALCLALIGLLLLRARRSASLGALLLMVNAWYGVVVLWNLWVLTAIG